MRREQLAELQTQENLLMWLLAECDPVDVRITVFQIRRVRRQMTAMRRSEMIGKVRLLVALFVVMILSGFVVSAQGDVSGGGAIVIQPEGLLYSIIGALVGGLIGAGGLYYKFKGTKPAQDLDENSRNGMLGLLLVGGWLASLTPGQWDDQQLDKLMVSNGFQKPAWASPHPLSPSPKAGEGESVGAQSLPFKAVRRSPAPPVHDFIDDEVHG